VAIGDILCEYQRPGGDAPPRHALRVRSDLRAKRPDAGKGEVGGRKRVKLAAHLAELLFIVGEH
jgi:hypothetical protein